MLFTEDNVFGRILSERAKPVFDLTHFVDEYEKIWEEEILTSQEDERMLDDGMMILKRDILLYDLSIQTKIAEEICSPIPLGRQIEQIEQALGMVMADIGHQSFQMRHVLQGINILHSFGSHTAQELFEINEYNHRQFGFLAGMNASGKGDNSQALLYLKFDSHKMLITNSENGNIGDHFAIESPRDLSRLAFEAEYKALLGNRDYFREDGKPEMGEMDLLEAEGQAYNIVLTSHLIEPEVARKMYQYSVLKGMSLQIFPYKLLCLSEVDRTEFSEWIDESYKFTTGSMLFQSGTDGKYTCNFSAQFLFAKLLIQRNEEGLAWDVIQAVKNVREQNPDEHEFAEGCIMQDGKVTGVHKMVVTARTYLAEALFYAEVGEIATAMGLYEKSLNSDCYDEGSDEWIRYSPDRDRNSRSTNDKLLDLLVRYTLNLPSQKWVDTVIALFANERAQKRVPPTLQF